MGHYPFTYFNIVTGIILLLTVALVLGRFRGALRANWPLVIYALIVAYTVGLSGGLNRYWVAAAVACGVAIRFGVRPDEVRWVEMVPAAYIVWRCVGLIMMW